MFVHRTAHEFMWMSDKEYPKEPTELIKEDQKETKMVHISKYPGKKPQAPEAPISPPDAQKSLSDLFQERVADHRQAQQDVLKTARLLGEQVRKLNQLGLSDVGLEFATYDHFQKFKLIGKKDPSHAYFILSVYDAQYLIKALKDNTVWFHDQNMSKYREKITDIDKEETWVQYGQKSYRIFDLGKEEDRTNFLKGLVETAAVFEAENDFRAHESLPTRQARIAKPG